MKIPRTSKAVAVGASAALIFTAAFRALDVYGLRTWALCLPLFIAALFLAGLAGLWLLSYAIQAWVALVVAADERRKRRAHRFGALPARLGKFHLPDGALPSEVRAYRPLPADHPAVRGGLTCPVCETGFAPGDVTTLYPLDGTGDGHVVEASLLHHTCALWFTGPRRS